MMPSRTSENVRSVFESIVDVRQCRVTRLCNADCATNRNFPRRVEKFLLVLIGSRRKSSDKVVLFVFVFLRKRTKEVVSAWSIPPSVQSTIYSNHLSATEKYIKVLRAWESRSNI